MTIENGSEQGVMRFLFFCGLVKPARLSMFPNVLAAGHTHLLGADSYAVTYSFVASGNFKAASDSNTRITLTADTTSTALVSSTTTSNYGDFVTFTATVSSLSTATGSVSFFDNGNPLGSAATLVAGKAAVQTGSLSVGAHSITAAYMSDSPNYIGSSSPVFTLTTRALAAVFSNVTPSQNVNGTISTVNLVGTISSAPSSGTVLQCLTATTDFGNGVQLQNDVAGVSTEGATYSVWIKTTSKLNQMLFQVTNLHPIIAMTGDQLSVQWDFSGAVQTSIDTRPICDGNWHQIAVVFNKGVVTLYKDGIATSDSFTAPRASTSDGNTNLGGALSDISSFQGQMWNAKIWAGALSNADIAADMNQTYASGIPANLRLLASFDAKANTATNLVNGQTTAINSGTFASIASTVLPAYYPAPGEPVTFTIGSQTQTANIGVDGTFVSTFPVDSLTPGIHSIQYSYQGNAYLASETDESTNLTVADHSTITVLRSSAPTTVFSTPIALTTTVTSQNGTPTGTVSFEDGGNTMGSPIALVDGRATFGRLRYPSGRMSSPPCTTVTTRLTT